MGWQARDTQITASVRRHNADEDRAPRYEPITPLVHGWDRDLETEGG